MKRLAYALMLSTIATSAFAADAIVYEEPVAAPVETTFFSWTGGYVGLHAGYAWGGENDNQSDLIFIPTISSADRFDVDGFIGGVHAGYNWQSGNFVFGVEGDIDYANVEGGTDFNYDGVLLGDLSFESDWQASLRLRAGYAMDTWLLYATGGVAVGHAELTAAGTYFGTPFSNSDDNTHVGWTIGAGVEKAFTPNWIGRAEVRYTDFGSESYDLDPAGVGVDSDWNQTAVNIGVSYKF
jgi:outer membrane immunogenic protein